jgi:hypothetical protein
MHPLTTESLAAHAPNAKMVYVGDSDTAYYEVVRAHWTGTSDLVIIEQDIEITAAVLPTFSMCSEPWCSFSYQLREAGKSVLMKDGLGCVKFSAELQQSVSFNQVQGDHHWAWLDSRLCDAIRDAGFSVHVHDGELRHLHHENDPDSECQSCRVFAIIKSMQFTEDSPIVTITPDGEVEDIKTLPELVKPKHHWWSR